MIVAVELAENLRTIECTESLIANADTIFALSAVGAVVRTQFRLTSGPSIAVVTGAGSVVADSVSRTVWNRADLRVAALGLPSIVTGTDATGSVANSVSGASVGADHRRTIQTFVSGLAGTDSASAGAVASARRRSRAWGRRG